jgi:hypothetical protein
MLGQRAIAHVVEHNPRHPVLFAYARTLHLTAKQTMTVAGCKTTHQRARREFGAPHALSPRRILRKLCTLRAAANVKRNSMVPADLRVQKRPKTFRHLMSATVPAVRQNTRDRELVLRVLPLLILIRERRVNELAGAGASLVLTVWINAFKVSLRAARFCKLRTIRARTTAFGTKVAFANTCETSGRMCVNVIVANGPSTEILKGPSQRVSGTLSGSTTVVS